jgi:hypothetical protein
MTARARRSGWLALGVTSLLLCACGEPRIEGELAFETKMARLQACNRLWRTEGFSRVTPDASGRVDQLEFEQIGPAKQRRLAELVACQRSHGAVEPMVIQFYVSGRNLKRISATNDIDFASQL